MLVEQEVEIFDWHLKVNSVLFLPWDTMLCDATRSLWSQFCLSVCQSVRLSHSCTVSTWFDLRSISSPYGSLIILVSGDIKFIQKFEGDHPKRGHWMRVNEGGVGTNWRFSTNKPPYLRNGARYDKGYYWSLIGNQICAFDWYQNQRPWLTLKW